MNKQYVLIISLLTLPILLMGALDRSTIATDSTTTSKIISKPGTVNTYRPGTTVTAPDTSTINELYDPTGKLYPPCPGDPSNTSNNIPQTPFCPGINGWPSNTPWDPNAYWNGTSTYAQAANVSGTQIYRNKDIYCPDNCIVTRYEQNPPTGPVTGLILASNFQDASCPAGYVQVTDFNPRPAIVHMDLPQVIHGPFSSTAALNEYKNSPTVYDCSIEYDPTSDPSSPNNIPMSATEGSRQHAVNYSYPKPNQGTKCSDKVDGGVRGKDLWYITDDVDMPIDGNIGQWVSLWTWTPYDNADNANCFPSDITKCGIDSHNIYDSDCSGAPSGSGIEHRDVYYHYYLWERCVPKMLSSNFYTDAYQAASHLCTRIKPAWQH